MKKEYCVYVHTNKTNGKRYVGITSQRPESRWKNGYKYNEHFQNAIGKYGWDGFDHKVLFSGLSKDCACDLEIALIDEWKCTNPDYGYNIQSGGECSAEQNNVAVDQFSLDGKYIKTWASMKEAAESFGVDTEGHGTQIGMACVGKQCKSAFGYMWRFAKHDKSDIVPYKEWSKRFRKVAQYTTEGKLVKVWDTIKDAAIYLGIDSGSITNVCKGKYYRSAGGFVWRYCEGDVALSIDAVKPYKRSVMQYTKDGDFIRLFESVSDASRSVGASSNAHIIACCKGGRKTAYGFIWGYANEI